MSGNDMMKTFRAGLFFLCILLALPFASGMTALGDRDLAAIRGSGVALDITGTAYVNVGSFWYQDTDTGSKIELDNIVWGDGSGGGFSIATPAGDPFTLNVGTSAAGQTLIDLHDSTQVSPRTFSADLIFCGQPLGSLKVSDIVRTGNNLLIGANGGVEFEYQSNIAIGSALYNYNTTNALALTGIHFFGTTVVGAPENPSTWTSYPGVFQIGDIAGGNPAQFIIGSTADNSSTAMLLGLPMTGSIRVQDVNFGGADLGPLALDGLNVHRLAIVMHP
jgi:hypothetical protein